MFVTILCGDGQIELFNLNCKLVHFTRRVKERCGLDVRECVELMNSSGSVMNLEKKQHSEDRASSMLAPRHHYVLLRVSRDEETGDRRLVPLLKNYHQTHPGLTELLRKLSNPNKDGYTRRRPQKRPPVRDKKNQSANDKTHRSK